LLATEISKIVSVVFRRFQRYYNNGDEIHCFDEAEIPMLEPLAKISTIIMDLQ